MKTIKASTKNYGQKRPHWKVSYIVIHYTAGRTDTAENEGRYFSRPVNPKASAHFFVDRAGNVVKSVPLDYVAWSVGGHKYPSCRTTGGGKYYGICTNSNSVSIELCAIADKEPSAKQIQAVKSTIRYIRKYCPNAKTIIRHFDVTGKQCPGRMCMSDAGDKRWAEFKAKL